MPCVAAVVEGCGGVEGRDAGDTRLCRPEARLVAGERVGGVLVCARVVAAHTWGS